MTYDLDAQLRKLSGLEGHRYRVTLSDFQKTTKGIEAGIL